MATAEVGTVIGCHSVDDWKNHFQRGADSKKLVLGLERLPYLSDDSKHGLDLLRTLTDLIHIISRNVVVDFTASWCGPCRVISPVLAELAKKFLDVIFLKVDVDELKTVAGEWEVEAMPTFLFLKEGKLVDKLVGAKKDELPKLIEKHAAFATSTSSA